MILLFGIGVVIFLMLIPILITALFYSFKPNSSPVEGILWIFFSFTIPFFLFVLIGHSTPHDVAIDPISIDHQCYSPLSRDHLLSFLLFFGLSFFSILVVSFKRLQLPPLVITICLALIAIGIFVNISFILQVTNHDVYDIYGYGNNSKSTTKILTLVPIQIILISILLFISIVREKAKYNDKYVFQNSFLNSINQILLRSRHIPLIALLLTLPVFVFITFVLLLFGQEVDSLVKVYTDTATWRFSQEQHPPILDHTGHYLCTVAAKGNPKVVNPLFIGQRNNRFIIVNRQLQIANAFEEMISSISPSLHRVIRSNYDNYGYNLSTLINNSMGSNLVFYLMKPLEGVFLVALYFYYVKPEKAIARQYK